MRLALGTLLILLPALPACAATDNPVLVAYVTRVVSPADFYIDGLHVQLRPDTVLRTDGNTKAFQPFVGEIANAWGKVDRNGRLLDAQEILLVPPQPEKVDGSAIVDDTTPPAAGAQILSADGRRLSVPGSLFAHPLASTSGVPAPAASPEVIRTNTWIKYHGTQRADGIVEVETLELADNKITKYEGGLRKHFEYDPTAVPDDAHQSAASTFFKGRDPKLIPPYHDEAMQARIDRIGKSLVPAYQRVLPADDPTRIDFRFQLVDQPKWGDACDLSSGIILVPRHIVAALHDDSQLAAVLADNIATAIEKQFYRAVVRANKLAVLSIAASAVPVVGLGLGSIAVTSITQHYKLSAQLRQSGRVALTLMHDAGYDLTQAPEAWWILAGKADEEPHRSSPPPRALNQLEALGTVWQPASPLATPPPTATLP